MISITPSNYHFFYNKWIKKLDNLDTEDKKTEYANKIANELWTFSNSNPNNALAPCITKLSDQISHKNITPKLIMGTLNKINQVDSKLILS